METNSGSRTGLSLAVLRLLNQRASGEKFAQPEAVVRWMGAIQAQDYAQAVWAVGLRLQAPSQAAVERAIEQAKIVRTWPIRGTIHFVPAEDARWMAQLSAQRLLPLARRRCAQLGLDDSTLARSRQVIANALDGGEPLARRALLAALEQAGIGTQGQRGYHLLQHAALAGLICIGPTREKQQTFALLDSWVPASRTPERDEALAALARRYFTSHGPAALADFAWWSGLTAADARAALASVAGELEPLQAGGQTYWRAPQLPPPDPAAGRVHLLPGFDEFLLGYKDRAAQLPAEHAEKIVPGGNGLFRPMLVLDGQIAGTWSRKAKKGAEAVAVTSFDDAPIPPRDLAAAIERYLAFLENRLG